jgi:hypothetical protein
MTNRKKNPGARAGASGAGKPVQSAAEGKGKLARQKRAVTFTVNPHDHDAAPVTIAVYGRVLWALERLAVAGLRGCTPITEPAPRWAAYVHTLRGLGVSIETVHEEHEGDFPGTHARYVLRATVTKATEGGKPDGETL